MIHLIILRRPVVLLLFLAALIMMPTGLVSAQNPDNGEMGRWSGGTGMGFLGGTPDGVEFALNGHLDYFMEKDISIGPLETTSNGCLARFDGTPSTRHGLRIHFGFATPGQKVSY